MTTLYKFDGHFVGAAKFVKKRLLKKILQLLKNESKVNYKSVLGGVWTIALCHLIRRCLEFYIMKIKGEDKPYWEIGHSHPHQSSIGPLITCPYTTSLTTPKRVYMEQTNFTQWQFWGLYLVLRVSLEHQKIWNHILKTSNMNITISPCYEIQHT